MQPNYYSDVSKVAEVLRNFSDYRKKPGKRGGGKTWPGLQHFEQVDVDRIALKGYASKALHQIQTLAETAVSENVKLNANRDLLDRAGWKPVEKSEIKEVSDLQNMTDEELQAELDALYKADGKKLVDA